MALAQIGMAAFAQRTHRPVGRMSFQQSLIHECSNSINFVCPECHLQLVEIFLLADVKLSFSALVERGQYHTNKVQIKLV